MIPSVFSGWCTLVVQSRRPLALYGAHGEAVLAHDFPDARAEEEGGARHAEVGVEVDSAHALGLAFEEGAVVGVEERGEQVCEHVLDATRVDLVAGDAAEDGRVVEFAPGGRRGGLTTARINSCAGQLKAAGGVGQNRKDGRIVGEKSVHEAVSGSDREDQENEAVLHVVGRRQIYSTAYFIEKK